MIQNENYELLTKPKSDFETSQRMHPAFGKIASRSLCETPNNSKQNSSNSAIDDDVECMIPSGIEV